MCVMFARLRAALFLSAKTLQLRPSQLINHQDFSSIPLSVIQRLGMPMPRYCQDRGVSRILRVRRDQPSDVDIVAGNLIHGHD